MKTDGKNVKWKSKEQREKENRRIRWIFLILFLLVLLGFGGMGYRVWKQYSKDLMQNQYDQLSNSSKILSESLETSMKEYEWDYEMLHNIEVMMQDEAGNYKISVRAVAGNTSADLDLEVVVTGTYQMELTTPRGLLSTEITAGDVKRLELVVRNTGSSLLKDIQLSSGKPTDWEVSFEPAKIEMLKAGETTTVTAVMKASKKALPGDYIATMEARTPEVNATAQFRIAVKTPMLWGWVGILVIVVAVGGVYYLFRKYGRR